MSLAINKLCNLNYFVRDTFISAIKIKYTNNQHLFLLSSLFNSVKYSAQNANGGLFLVSKMDVLPSKLDFLYPKNSYFLLLR